MFTGIIEGLGTISKLRPSGQGRRIAITADFGLGQTKIGDSIAVNGACLTAVRIDSNRFEADLSPETILRTTFGKASTGDRVNLERALRFSDRLDGHLVSGHIDGVGEITEMKSSGNVILISFSADESLTRYMIPKGSIAVDGISLTINHCSRNGFEVSIIPHTAGLTSLGFKKKGEHVNLETDMIGKYVERFVRAPGQDRTGNKEKKSAVDMELLAKSGFL